MSEQNFEKALAELENIVEKMEKGGLALNESLALFEKGVKLARFLREELGKAEKKINILLENNKGEMKEEPFELVDKEGEVLEKQENGNPDDDKELPF
jgi:exodeoxyribonuclease VII small subunit